MVEIEDKCLEQKMSAYGTFLAQCATTRTVWAISPEMILINVKVENTQYNLSLAVPMMSPQSY